MDENEIRIFGYCKYCGEQITDEGEEYYVNSDGEVFCSVECVLENYCVDKIEL